MLTKQFPLSLDGKSHGKQDGVVLLIALILLVAMTLAGIALVRSVYTTSVIAGNTTFQQAATNSADAGIEYAIAWLEGQNANPANLYNDNLTLGYSASLRDPSATQTWDYFFNTVLASQVVQSPSWPDNSGNYVSYTIQRICNTAGAPSNTTSACAVAPGTSGTAAGNSMGAGVQLLSYNSLVYYRITVKVAGPRNTVSYVQAVVAM